MFISRTCYIRTTSNFFPYYFSGCATVVAPPGHVIFFSSYYKTRASAEVNPFVFIGRCGEHPRIGQLMGEGHRIFPDFLLSPRVLSGTVGEEYQDQGLPMSLLHCHCKQYRPGRMDRLHVLFSFHRTTPRQVGERWNCSRSEWPDLHLHFPCDLQTQCVDGKDERRCHYYSETCGLGQISVMGSCFFVIKMIWYNFDRSEAFCRRRGALAASFASTRQWRTVLKSLSTLKKITSDTAEFWIGLHTSQDMLSTSLDTYVKNMYAYVWHWSSGSVAYNFHSSFIQVCEKAQVSRVTREEMTVTTERCTDRHHTWERAEGILCSRRPSTKDNKDKKGIVIRTAMNISASPVPLVTCRFGHVTHVTLACDRGSRCSGRVEHRGLSRTAVCRASESQRAPYFRCAGSDHSVPYSLVCDWSQDCGDNSDESFCQFPACGEGSFDCGQGQCIGARHQCDGIVHCKTHFDEERCETKGRVDIEVVFDVVPSPAVVVFDRPGAFSLEILPGNSSQCPETHFQCPGDGYCLPIYTKCNGMNDCPGHEDEEECDDYTCVGLYRCRGDKLICMHVQHLCDGRPQCPEQDDELMCELTESCPDQCICYGPHFSDHFVFQAETFPKIRYLEGRGSGLTLDVISNETMLIYLGAGACGWVNFSEIDLPNLHVLDISDNFMHHIKVAHISHFHHLKELDLSNNPLSNGFAGLGKRRSFHSLMLLNLSQVSVNNFQLHALADWVPELQMIDFSHSDLKSLRGIELFTNLKELRLQGCPALDFKPDFMKEMENVQQVFAEDFKLCCPAILPKDFLGKCVAPADEISSCKNLLKSGFYRAALAIFAVAALFGNLGSFVYRLWFSSSKRKVGYAVFVLHLSTSDFFMGVYLTIIGLADHLFAGSYLWKEYFWKRSAMCSISGFISLLSCEVSSILICLISLDRFLVIRFPFSRLHFRTTSAHVACTVSWGLGVILASVPLLPVTSHWAFYSQTGICIPLPVTRADFPGRHYSFSVMIVFNLVIFLLIAVGQAFIYWTIRVSAMRDDDSTTKDDVVVGNKTRTKDAVIARRLLVIAMSDFVCWFPIGVCGILAKLDVPVPGEVNVVMAVFVLPFNSALNPFLYTYTLVQEKHRKEKEAKLRKFVTAMIKAP